MRHLAVLAMLSSALSAQGITAHPQDSIQNSNGNLAPFGCISSTGITEGHSQVLIRGLELPGPGAFLTGIEVHCQGALALTYTTLNITVSATTATSLSSNFASNLITPIPVLQATNLTINWTGSYTPIALPLPYVHDGTSSLVIDIVKVVDPTTAQFATMSTTSNPPRNDLPPMAYAFGGPGSGASQATSAMYFAPPLSVRLQWAGVPTVHLLADQNAGGNQYGVGTTMTLSVDGAPGSLFVNLMGLQFLPVFQNVPPLLGEWRVQGVTLDVGFLPPSGTFQRPISLVNAAAFVGTQLTYQSGTVDGSGFAQFTNATDHVINP